MNPLVAGFGAWLAGLFLLPAPLAARILLLAPLVGVPGLLGRLPQRRVIGSLRLGDLGGLPALTAALPLLPAFALPAGPLAAGLTIPWLVLAGLLVVAAVVHGVHGLPRILHPTHAADLAADTALGFLGVGAVFATADRLGLRVMDFSATIGLLTAVHFHFAGFGLLSLAVLLAKRDDRLGLAAAIGLVIGMPLTATGFVLASSLVGWIGAVVVGVAGLGAALGFLRLAAAEPGRRRLAMTGAALALLVGVPLRVGWASAVLFELPFLDLDAMVRTHGALNGVAVTVAAVAWPPGGRP